MGGALTMGALAASDHLVAGAPFYGVNFDLFKMEDGDPSDMMQDIDDVELGEYIREAADIHIEDVFPGGKAAVDIRVCSSDANGAAKIRKLRSRHHRRRR